MCGLLNKRNFSMGLSQIAGEDCLMQNVQDFGSTPAMPSG